MNDENIYLIMLQEVFCSPPKKKKVNFYALGPKPKSFPEKGKYSLDVLLSGKKFLGLNQIRKIDNENCNFPVHMEN